MEAKDLFVMGLLIVLAIETFAIWLEMRWDRQASERADSRLHALFVLLQGSTLRDRHQSMLMPSVATGAPRPPSTRWGQYTPVDVTKDNDQGDIADDADQTLIMPRLAQWAPTEASTPASETLCPPPFHAVKPALGEDEEQPAASNTRVSPVIWTRKPEA